MLGPIELVPLFSQGASSLRITVGQYAQGTRLGAAHFRYGIEKVHVHSVTARTGSGAGLLRWRSITRKRPGSTVLSRSPADEPEHSLKEYSDNHDELREEAILGCNRDWIRAISMVMHTFTTGGGSPDAIQQLPAAHIHPVCTTA
jgi:hypothetical protein